MNSGAIRPGDLALAMLVVVVWGANFAVIKEWNAAKVYQQAIALMGAQIQG